jgi:L-threonylcarbamoyladenylate synthase
LTRGRVLDAHDSAAIAEAASTIVEGGLVAFPTETVYGLGADACNPVAVAKIFELKQRPAIDPLIVHVADPETARLLADFPEPVSSRLMKAFWPGPLTLVVPSRAIVPLIVTAGLETVAIRLPAHPVALALIRQSHRAIAAPSANPFGYVSPTNAGHIAGLFAQGIDLILDGGPCPIGLESTILSLVGPKPQLLRAGGIPPEALELVVGKLERATDPTAHPLAPGQLTRHYATRTPLEILAAESVRLMLPSGQKIGLLTLLPISDFPRFAAVEVLSPRGDLREAATNLFAALRRLDDLGLDRLIALPVPEQGLGMAIMDRLRRCSTRTC